MVEGKFHKQQLAFSYTFGGFAQRSAKSSVGIGIGIGSPKHWHYGKNHWHWHCELLALWEKRLALMAEKQLKVESRKLKVKAYRQFNIDLRGNVEHLFKHLFRF